jgi:hypothetical protein
MTSFGPLFLGAAILGLVGAVSLLFVLRPDPTAAPAGEAGGGGAALPAGARLRPW